VDATTFELHLNRPFDFVINALGKPGNIIPTMIHARLANLDIGGPVPKVVSSGPFLFRRSEWRPGDRAIFDRNPNYHPRAESPNGLSGGKVVHLDRIDLVSMPDQATRVAALRDPSITVTLQRGIEQTMTVISINHLQPPFNNVLIRRALQARDRAGRGDGGHGPAEKDMYLAKCLSIYMCNAPGTSDAGTDVYPPPEQTMQRNCCSKSATTMNRSSSCIPPSRRCSIRSG
jgi:peptide/nickel transport system substrate-binding protein